MKWIFKLQKIIMVKNELNANTKGFFSFFNFHTKKSHEMNLHGEVLNWNGERERKSNKFEKTDKVE